MCTSGTLHDPASSRGNRILIYGQQRDSRRPSTSYEPISARKWFHGHHGATRSTATLGVNLDPGAVAEGSRGLSAKRDTPGTRGQESPSTPKGSQSRCVHAARVGEGDRKRGVALQSLAPAGGYRLFASFETGRTVRSIAAEGTLVSVLAHSGSFLKASEARSMVFCIFSVSLMHP